ncbi:MAG: aminoglycoside 6-adenylyltransferase, partial [Treponema sp.]|nr:aminoglycoside 6-adenylyltransferase [Treponema sp.]
DYSVSVGKSYKYLQKYVSRELWEGLAATYQVNSPELVGKALKNCCNLFQEISGEVSAGLGYPPPGYGEPVLKYLRQFI